jgi:hypothetical protein
MYYNEPRERHIQPLAMRNLRHEVGHQGEYHTTWEESFLERHKGRSWPCDESREAFALVLCVYYSLSNRKGLSSCSGPYMLTEKLGAAKRITIFCTVIVRSGARIDFCRIPTIDGTCLTAWRQTIPHPNSMVHTPRNQVGLVEL